jgi:hypothetical protein
MSSPCVEPRPVLGAPLASLEADIAAVQARVDVLREELEAQLEALRKLEGRHTQAARFAPMLAFLEGIYDIRLRDLAKALGWGYAKTSAMVLEAESLGLVTRVGRGLYTLTR